MSKVIKFSDIVESYKEDKIVSSGNGKNAKCSSNVWLDKIVCKEYLPYNIKYGISNMMAINACDQSESGRLYVSSLKREMVKDLLLLSYTNVEQVELVDINDYDILKECGFFSDLECAIGEGKRDYELLIKSLDENIEQLIIDHEALYGGFNRFIKSIVSDILDSVVDTYKTKEGKSAIRGILKDINSNVALLETINNVSSRIGLENVKDELLARLKKADEVNKKKNNATKESKVKEKKE